MIFFRGDFTQRHRGAEFGRLCFSCGEISRNGTEGASAKFGRKMILRGGVEVKISWIYYVVRVLKKQNYNDGEVITRKR
jgi:hypothetical protein